MDITYLLAIEIFLGIFIFNFFPRIYGIFIFIFLISTVGIILKKRSPFYWIIPAVFIISFLFRMDNKVYQVGEKISDAKIKIYEGRGVVSKIGLKFPRKKSVLVLERVKNGEYKVWGRIEKKQEKNGEIIYSLKDQKIEEINRGYFILKFANRNEKLLENSRNDQKNLFMAVVLGEREMLYPRIKKLFVKNGVSHLLAISGMHIGILLFLMDLLLKKTKLYKRERNILLLFGITLYFILVRESPSLERAYIMAIIYILGNILYENTDNLKSLALAFMIGVILKPPIYNELSFVLSYWAMLIIFLIIPIQRRILEIIEEKFEIEKNLLNRGIIAIGNYMSFTFFLQLGIAPVIFYALGTFSMKSIFLSLIITPLGTIYIILCFVSLIFPIIPITNMWYNLLIKSMEFFH